MTVRALDSRGKAVDAILSELRIAASRPMEDAMAMPPSVYTSREILDLESERIFRHEWICVGRESTLAKSGDYVTSEIVGQPLVVIRGRDEKIRAYSNVCLHRMSTLLVGSGNAQVIVCPYHGWCYNIDGTLRAAPHMEANRGFCKADYQLPELRCEIWEGWIYVTLNPAIQPVADRLKPLYELIGRYRMGEYVETFREDHVWNTNWKILAENFMESYHLPILHRLTVGPHSRVEDMNCPPGGETFNYHWITKEASLPIGNAHPSNKHLKGEWRKTTALVTIYPTHLITLTPGYFWYLIVQPRDVDKVHMVYGGGMAPEFIADPKGLEYLTELKTILDAVNHEDQRGVEGVFIGMQARLAKGGHLSHLERPNYEFGRYLAHRLGVLNTTVESAKSRGIPIGPAASNKT